MRKLFAKVDGDAVDYWFMMALAVASVWMAWQADDRDSLFYLFGATYLLIHAHGRRILSAVKKQATATNPDRSQA